MYHLFYNGVSPEQPISAAERQELVDTRYDGYDPEVVSSSSPQSGGSRSGALGRSDSGRNRRAEYGSFAYLANYDAYYHFHGDTNALYDVCFYAGERSGDTVTLYYQPEQCGAQLVDTAGSGEEVWAKVTVAPQPGGRLPDPLQPALRSAGCSAVLPPPDRRGAVLFQHAVFQQSDHQRIRRRAAHAPQPVPHLPVCRPSGHQPVRPVL